MAGLIRACGRGIKRDGDGWVGGKDSGLRLPPGGNGVRPLNTSPPQCFKRGLRAWRVGMPGVAVWGPWRDGGGILRAWRRGLVLPRRRSIATPDWIRSPASPARGRGQALIGPARNRRKDSGLRLSPEWRVGRGRRFKSGIVESVNLPSVASGFPRPSGKNPPGADFRASPKGLEQGRSKQ